MKWLYHIAPPAIGSARPPAGEPYAPPSLASEGFIHASFKTRVEESASLYFQGASELDVLQIDPRRLDVPVRVVPTPRGDMPHIFGPIVPDAIHAVLTRGEVDRAPDDVLGTRFAFVAFAGMTLLDLVGVLDPLSRINTMGFDATSACEVIGADGDRVWGHGGAELFVESVRPALDGYDVVIVPGGPGVRALTRDREVVAWLETFPKNRLMASVCTGSLLLGAAQRLVGRRATTHHASMDLLRAYGAIPLQERVVDDGQIVTAGGVTCALDLGFHLLKRYVGEDAVRAIAAQMEMPE